MESDNFASRCRDIFYKRRKSWVSFNPHVQKVTILEIFFNFILNLGYRIVGGGGTVDGHSLLVGHELGEVPLDGVDQKSGLLLLEIDPERVGVATVHVDLGEHVEGDVVLLCEGLDVRLSSRLLTAKLIAGEGQNT